MGAPVTIQSIHSYPSSYRKILTDSCKMQKFPAMHKPGTSDVKMYVSCTLFLFVITMHRERIHRIIFQIACDRTIICL